MSDEKPGQEPSMEEVLASIRRIISEEDDTAAPKSTAGQGENGNGTTATASVGGAEAGTVTGNGATMATASDGDDQDSVLDLTQMLADDGSVVKMTNQSDNGAAEHVSDEELEFAENAQSAPESVPEPDEAATTVDDGAGPEDGLVASPETAGATVAAFGQLDDALRLGRVGLGDGERTLEDIVREVLHPILKTWVDENLPTMVERIVAQEIERMLSRGGRR
jgi:cell pole-organizing protein PopZ